jgi:hypothetical protein
MLKIYHKYKKCKLCNKRAITTNYFLAFGG